jgi:hypothetical protein
MSGLRNCDAHSSHIQTNPYCHCSPCALQAFFRGKLAIQRLTEVIESGILMSGGDSSSAKAITLDNRPNC